MPSLNKVSLIGHLGKDPEMRYTPNGKPVTGFSLATSRYTGQGDNRKQVTTWFSVTAWGSTAEYAAQYLKRGMLAYVEGEIELEEWDDRNTGEHRAKLAVTAREVKALSKQESESPSYERGDPDPDDIPF